MIISCTFDVSEFERHFVQLEVCSEFSTCPWQRWSGSFRRRGGTEPASGAQILQVEQAEINEHHRPNLFNTERHRMNIPSVEKKKKTRFVASFNYSNKTKKNMKSWQQPDSETELLFPTSRRGEILNAVTKTRTLKPAQSSWAYFFLK